MVKKECEERCICDKDEIVCYMLEFESVSSVGQNIFSEAD